MKITVVHLLIALSFSGLAVALPLKAQDFLNKPISLSVKEIKLSAVLQVIEQQTDARFVYSSRAIKADRKISVTVDGQRLSEFLQKVLSPLQITYRIVEGQIILNPAASPVVPAEATPGGPNGDATTSVDVTVTGTVNDENGAGLPGVSIVLKGTQRGTTTDPNGRFSISVPDSKPVLIFSFVGYLSQEVEVGNAADLKIILQADTKALEEVVVVGYGTQKVSDLTSSVARVSEKTLQSRPVANFQEALQGRTSGVQIRQTGGDLNGRFSINIRGVGSVTGANDPLIVVDGVPLFSSDFSTINPRDIVSIDVLKDASATAIYGARASNGVLNITTRRGKAGKTEFTFSTTQGFEHIAKRYDVLSTEQQRQLLIAAFKNTNRTTTVYEDLTHPAWGVDTDWQDLVTQTGTRQEYNLGISGGSEKNRFAVSATYLQRKGIIKTSALSSFFFRANNDVFFTPKFKISSSLSGSYQTQNPVNNDTFHGGAYKSSISVHSYVEPFNPDGSLKGITTTADPYFGENRNPLIDLYLPSRKATSNRLLGNLKADWELLEGLTLSGNLGADLLYQNNFTYLPTYRIGLYALDIGSSAAYSGQQINWVTDATLQYAKTIDRHDFKVLVGTSSQAFYNKIANVTGTGTVDNQLNQLANQTNFTGTGSDVTAGLSSFFGRLNYGFADRYLLTATIRRDGSSKFGPSNRFGTFPSASAAWRISDEAFLKNQSLVSELKLRVGYGLTGNQNIGDYAFITRASAAQYVFGNSPVVGNAPQNVGNPQLQWESAQQFDIGLDMGFLRNRLEVTLDYYDKTSKNLLIRTPVPFTAGVIEDPIVNIGSVQNRGVEFAATSRNLVGKLTWTTDFNLTYNQNKVLDIGTNSIGNPLEIPGYTLELPGEPANLTRAGGPVGAFYMYRFDGIWQTAEKDQAAQYGAVPGDPKYADLNNNGKFDTGDKGFAGSPNPKFFGGMTNSVSYGPFSLSVFLQFSTGSYLYNSMRNLNARSVPFNQQLAEIADFWTPENPSNSVPRASQGGNTTYLATRVSTRFLEKADFLRLKDISLSYDLPTTLTRSLKLSRARLSLQAINLLTITGYSGLDPEAASRADLLSGGIDNTPYPLTRMYSATLQIGF